MKKRRKEDGDMKAVNITRAVYKDIKRYDHKQMNEFLTRYYINGFSVIWKSCNGQLVEEMWYKKVVLVRY